MYCPKVSIIVPVYNVEKYLDRCMKSLLHQTLQDIEIILVNDGSPDNCAKMCDSYADQDCRVRVIHKENAGLGYARNSGLDVATGEYVAFVDSDDFVSETIFSELYAIAKYNKVDACFFNFTMFNREGHTTQINEVDGDVSFSGKNEIQSFLLDMIGSDPKISKDRIYSMSVWHCIYSKSIIDKNSIRFKSERDFVSEDILFQIEFLHKADSIRFVKNNGYFYCENVLSLSKSYRRDRFSKYKILHESLIKILSDIYRNDVDRITLSVDRLFLGYVRHMILIYKLTDKELRLIINDNYFKAVLKRYPYQKLSFPHAVFFCLTHVGYSLPIRLIKSLT